MKNRCDSNNLYELPDDTGQQMSKFLYLWWICY